MTLQERIKRNESFIVANDGQYLGKLSLNMYDLESIINIYGLYGSLYSATSINNKYCVYGSPYSSLSPYNQYTSTPPIIYLRGKRCGYLSLNRYLLGSINPHNIKEWMKINNLY